MQRQQTAPQAGYQFGWRTRSYDLAMINGRNSFAPMFGFIHAMGCEENRSVFLLQFWMMALRWRRDCQVGDDDFVVSRGRICNPGKGKAFKLEGSKGARAGIVLHRDGLRIAWKQPEARNTYVRKRRSAYTLAGCSCDRGFEIRDPAISSQNPNFEFPIGMRQSMVPGPS